MSLKAFHVIFLVAATLLALLMGGWFLHEYFAHSRRLVDLIFGIVSLAGGVALIIYGRYFLKKLRNIDYF